MSTIDYDRAYILMKVIKIAADLGPKEANSISGMAMVELREMEAVAKEELAELAAAAKAEEAERQRELAVKAQADRDEAEAMVEASQPKAIPAKRLDSPTTAEIADNHARRY